MNHFAGKIVVSAQDNLMRARDERVALMNEVLGAIRMLKVSGGVCLSVCLCLCVCASVCLCLCRLCPCTTHWRSLDSLLVLIGQPAGAHWTTRWRSLNRTAR